jgi:hypothetical protein
MSALNLRHTDSGGASLILPSWANRMCFAWSAPEVAHLSLTVWFFLSNLSKALKTQDVYSTLRDPTTLEKSSCRSALIFNSGS